jgi:hypothetical protein
MLAILAPICCVALGLVLVWPQFARVRAVAEEIETAQGEIETKQRAIAAAEAAAMGRPLALAVALNEEKEPIVFLRQLSALVEGSGAAFVGIRGTTLPPIPAPGPSRPGQQSAQGPGGAVPPLGGQRPVLPATVDEITDEVSVEGTFGSILSLLVRLESFERILSVSRCRITAGGRAGYPRLNAVFTLSRFAARPEPVTPEPAVARPPR